MGIGSCCLDLDTSEIPFSNLSTVWWRVATSLYVFAAAPMPTGRIQEKYTNSIQVVDTNARDIPMGKFRQDERKLSKLGFKKSVTTQEVRDDSGEKALKTTFNFATPVKAKTLMRNIAALSKSFPHVITQSTVDEFHRLLSVYEEGDPEVTKILNNHPRLEITFAVSRPKDRRRRKRAIFTLTALATGVSLAGGVISGWWGR